MHAGLPLRRLLPLVATLLVALGGPPAATSAASGPGEVGGAHASLHAPAGAPSGAKAVRSATSPFLAGALAGEGGATLGDGRAWARPAADPASAASSGRPALSRRLPASAPLHLLASRAVAGEADLPPPPLS